MMIDMNNIHPYHPLPDKSRRRSSQRKLDLQDSAADGPDARASRIARLSNEVQTSILPPLSEAPIPSRLPSLAPSMAVSPIPTHNQSLQFNLAHGKPACSQRTRKTGSAPLPQSKGFKFTADEDDLLVDLKQRQCLSWKED